MPKIIDHEKRKEEILKQAFALFSQKGYQNTSLSQLADECRISRPTLYLYFRDKEEIFRFAIKQFTDKMITDYKDAARDRDKSATDILRFICQDIVDRCYTNEDFIKSLADFIIQMRHQGVDITEAITRRTIRMKYLFSQLITKGIRKGTIRDVSVQDVVDQLLALIMSFIFQIALIGQINRDLAVRNLVFFIENLENP
jgi:AcrR family transcriptional regulator